MKKKKKKKLTEILYVGLRWMIENIVCSNGISKQENQREREGEGEGGKRVIYRRVVRQVPRWVHFWDSINCYSQLPILFFFLFYFFPLYNHIHFLPFCNYQYRPTFSSFNANRIFLPESVGFFLSLFHFIYLHFAFLSMDAAN